MERRKFLKYLGLGSIAAIFPWNAETVPNEELWSPLEFTQGIEIERKMFEAGVKQYSFTTTSTTDDDDIMWVSCDVRKKVA